MAVLTREDVAALERIEVAACRSWIAAAPPAVARDLGVALLPVGSGIAVRASRVDVLSYNRVVGLGVGEPARSADLDDAIAFFRDAGVPRMMVNLAPTATPRLEEWLAERGFALHNHWIRLWRDTSVPVTAAPDPRVRPIGREHAMSFGRTDVEAYRHPEALSPLIATTVGLPGWRHWAAFEGEEAVAFGALFASGGTGWLGFGCTRAEHRGKGMQTAIIAARIRAATERGCRLLAVETADDTPEKPNSSTHNLVAMGFDVAYRRPNWVLKLA
jgi:GNAT superfamily N-acetyltransferase